jgi:hypothetical protein
MSKGKKSIWAACLFVLAGLLPKTSTAGLSGPAPADAYLQLRKRVLILPQDAAMKSMATGNGPLAVLMETTEREDGFTYTLVAVADGSVSLYFSNGGGIIGAGEHQDVRAVAGDFLAASGGYLSAMKPVADYPLPGPGKTRFYIVGKTGVLSGEFEENDLGNNRLPASPLFHKGHDVITAVRMTQEQQKK